MRGINKDTLLRHSALSDRPEFREMNLGGGRVRHRTRAQEAEEVPGQDVGCIHVHTHIYVHATACIWRSEDNLRESGASFYHVGPGHQTRVVSFGKQAPLSAELSLWSWVCFFWVVKGLFHHTSLSFT